MVMSWEWKQKPRILKEENEEGSTTKQFNGINIKVKCWQLKWMERYDEEAPIDVLPNEDFYSSSWRAERRLFRGKGKGKGRRALELRNVTEQGADRVVIPVEEWKAATSKFEFALVGFVFGSKPFLGRMKGFARVKWGDESVVRVSQLNEGIFLFKFHSEDKKAEVMSGGPWTFDNRPLILKPWSEHEEYTCGSGDALPVWIRLPRLKAHLADNIILSRLCSRFGTPLCTDGVTAEGSSYNYARVCVQIYADQEFMDYIEYEDPYGNCFVQPVEYEWKPPQCHNCCNFGHLSEKCLEPNFEMMLDGLKEREKSDRARMDKREACDEEFECDEETMGRRTQWRGLGAGGISMCS
ncbi:hypothetical protein QQ045_029948 [Rhodiola kirilowii]